LNNVLPQSEKDLGSELISPPAQRQDKDKNLEILTIEARGTICGI
jgi:hypothetical protein